MTTILESSSIIQNCGRRPILHFFVFFMLPSIYFYYIFIVQFKNIIKSEKCIENMIVFVQSSSSLISICANRVYFENRKESCIHGHTSNLNVMARRTNNMSASIANVCLLSVRFVLSYPRMYARQWHHLCNRMPSAKRQTIERRSRKQFQQRFLHILSERKKQNIYRICINKLLKNVLQRFMFGQPLFRPFFAWCLRCLVVSVMIFACGKQHSTSRLREQSDHNIIEWKYEFYAFHSISVVVMASPIEQNYDIAVKIDFMHV